MASILHAANIYKIYMHWLWRASDMWKMNYPIFTFVGRIYSPKRKKEKTHRFISAHRTHTVHSMIAGTHIKANATKQKSPQKILILKSIKILSTQHIYMRLCRRSGRRESPTLANHCECTASMY